MTKAVEVAAAVIQRPDGTFLLAQRPQGKVYAGYWEFPGGKVEPGEPVDAALARELHEELGIDIEDSYPWITRVFTYPHATVRLNFRRVLRWKGEPHPREDQAIAWQRIDAPMAEPMLPANAPVLASLALPVTYAVTDAARLGVPAMLERLEARMQAGLRLVQVREPGLPEAESRAFAAKVVAMARRHGCKVMTKEPVEGADGIHYRAKELMALGEKPAGMAAASCHSRKELDHAAALGFDFVVLGPVKPTPSHPGAPGMGWEAFARLAAGTPIPVYAIGGLSADDLDAAWRCGAHGVAMVSAAWR